MFRSRLPIAALALLLAACSGSEPEDASPRPSPAEGVVDAAGIPRHDPFVRRLLVFGIDGATWDLLDPVLAAGEAPNLERLVQQGVRAELHTLEPTLSPAIWTTVATGTTPDVHGILGFDGVPGQTMTTLPNANMRRRKTYWNILSDFGVSTGTVGWWATWPADPLPAGSFLVSDRVPYTRMEAAIHRAPLDAGDVVPSSLEDVVLPLVERPDDIDRDVLRRFLKLDTPEDQERFLEIGYEMGNFLPEFKFVYQSDLSTIRMAKAAIRAMPVQVLSVYVTGVDTVSHLYWQFMDPKDFPRYEIPQSEVARFGDVIRLYYRQVDEWLGELLSAVGEGTTVLVLSDHGFGPTGHLPWSGGHGRITPGAPIAPAGIFILSGPGAASGVQLTRAHVLDVAPTILHLLGLPTADDMPGSVLTEALAPEASIDLPTVPTYENVGSIRHPGETPVNPAADAERLERLRALGYIQ
jgi:Type I phosphodiesterase / nucleotide pyrophosphatase